MKHSKQILSITNAAVNALASAKDDYSDKKVDLKRGSLQRTSTLRNTKDDVARYQNSHRYSTNANSSCSTADDKVSENMSGEVKDTSSSSSFELSFNGTRRVKVPSRLLREIKSPLERSFSSSESREIPGVSNIGTKAYDKVKEILMKKSLLGDIKRLSPNAETSCLEGFHSTLNQWHPKMMCFSWLGTFCRHILASLHFNENLRRDSKKTKEGKTYVNVTYPKFKMGEEVVREVAEPPTYVDEQTRPTPVKVIRHINGPTAWISSSTDDPLCYVKPPDPVKTHGESSRHDPVSEKMSQRSEVRGLAGNPVSDVMVKCTVDDGHRLETYERRKNAHVKGLFQGEPKSGVPVFEPGKENAGTCDVKIKQFVLSDKEKAIKEQFLRRQDQKKPAKKLVQPTLVLPQMSDRKDTQESVGSSDNPIATAAAIAAAAASAATGPFLQLQHSLEAQIAALVSNLQVLQQAHDTQPRSQDTEKDKELQRQMEERLQRLEELQEKMLQAQSVQSASVSNPVPQNLPTTTHPKTSLNPAVMLSSDHLAGDGCPPGLEVPAPNASRVAWHDDRTQISPSVTGHYLPHTTHESQHDPKGLYRYAGSRPSFEKHKLVRNTRTQTSPQESVSSEESLLQTPLPRKRPPVPAVPGSHYNLPRSRYKGTRSDVDRGGEKKARVHFEPDASPALPSYKAEMTDKGRGLVRELVSLDSAAKGHTTNMEAEKSADRSGVAPVSTETAVLSKEVGKIKTDLQEILTETERLKQELVQHQLLKDEATGNHSSVSRFRAVGPSPLDEYLEPLYTTAPRGHTASTTGAVPTNSVRHYADAERILQDVQQRRENLDRNLRAVIRQREEKDLYNLVDSMTPLPGEFDEMLRIRMEVDKRIGEITATVQREINQETRGTSEEEQGGNITKKQKSLPVKAPLSGPKRVEQRRATQGLVVGKKVVKKPTGKENLPEKMVEKKSKTQAPPKRPATVTPAQKQVYLSSVYGKQPYHPQRTTSKAPYLHYQSPVNPKTAAIMAGLMAGDRGTVGKPVLQDVTSIPEKDVPESRKKKPGAAKPSSSHLGQPSLRKDNTQYYFHPRVNLSHFGPEEGRVAVPLEGQLVPMAIPLGKPKTDPALRPPIATHDEQSTPQIKDNPDRPTSDSIKSSNGSESLTSVSSPVRPRKPARPNVAVITVYGRELDEGATHQHKQHKKSPAKKKRSSLAVQVLPTVDIDSFSDTTSSSPSLPHISDIPEPVSRPDDSEYQEFRNFLAVTETGPQKRDDQAPDDAENDDDLYRLPTPQHPLTLEGFRGEHDLPYNGPPFPPVHPPVSVQQTGGVLEADSRQVEALQDRAMEWIEQELLARIVSEMNQPVPDPTGVTRPQATPESSTVSEPDDEDAGMLAATIGLGGIQLFVDAGLPVDRDLVTNLIREVITENVSTVLGHPKPRARQTATRQSPSEEEHPSPSLSPRETPLPTPTPTPEYTPPESEESAHESEVLATPVRTPTPSATSEELTPPASKEEEQVFEPIRDEQVQEKEEEETGDQVSQVNTTVCTPVPTPPPAQSPPASISTPEPSLQEPEVSQDTVVPTPPPSVVVKTPTPEPELERELSVSEEPSQPKEPSVSQKELTPSQPAQPLVSSPSSLSSTTLVTTTTITTEDEMSEGELIQPYAHAGVYSEGEFAISPSIVQLAAERKLPLVGDWDATILGKDEDSRNELTRIAVNGILQHGEGGKTRDHGSSGVSDSPYQVSSASTLRDTESIREDSIADVSDREPGEVSARDPMAVLLSRIQNYRPPVMDNSASEGELIQDHLPMPDVGQGKIVKEPGEIVSRKLSPGEVVVWEPSGAVRNLPTPLPEEFSLDNEPWDEKGNKIVTVPGADTRTAEGQPNRDDRSLHASDLLPGTLGTDISFPVAQQQHTKSRLIHVDEKDNQPSEASLQNTYSVEKRKGGPSALAGDYGGKEKKSVPGSKEDRLDIEDERNRDSEVDEKEIEPQQPTKIQVTLPSVDNSALEDSSVPSDTHVSVDQDTFGDVSSISGGDF